MAKFHGKVGYATTVTTVPGVRAEQIIERTYTGDITRNTRNLQEAEKVNDDLTVSNTIEIVADAYMTEHFFAIRFVEWAGVCWKVDNVEVRSPRLLLRLGGVYNGRRAEASPTPDPAPDDDGPG